MRTPDCRAIRPGHVGRALALAFVLLLAGCAGFASKVPYNEASPWNDMRPTGQEKRLMYSDFSIEIVRFKDGRAPQVAQQGMSEDYIYRYEPDELMHGVRARVPMLMTMYMDYRPRMAKHYKVEVELRQLDADILTGTLASGSRGIYRMRMEMAALVRRSDSSVALRRNYRAEFEEPRHSNNGRGPTKAEDAAAMYAMINKGIRQISANIGWDVHSGDARRWDVSATMPMPPRAIGIVPRHAVGE